MEAHERREMWERGKRAKTTTEEAWGGWCSKKWAEQEVWKMGVKKEEH